MINKTEVLADLHAHLAPEVQRIAELGICYKKKAQRVNAAVAEQRARLVESIREMPTEERGTAALVIQYCCTVVYLEYRQKVWPYEYMAFSRRIGELWEAFCRTAWTYPVKPNVTRFDAPQFTDVRRALLESITSNLGTHSKIKEIMVDVSTLFEIVGDINMREDEVFHKDLVPHVVDFKSGFGSNELGYMLRLLAVGRAYRIWDHRTKLMLLVRQEENNNYLERLRNSGFWEVQTGVRSYEKIEFLTGANIQNVRDKIVSWQEDLSEGFYSYLKSQPTDLTNYLVW